MIQHAVYNPPLVKAGRGVLTIISFPKLLCYLGVVRPSHNANLHFPPQSLEKLIQLWVDFLQITRKCTASYHFVLTIGGTHTGITIMLLKHH